MVTKVIFNALDIAPCGINCHTCYAYLRKKKPCQGCNGVDGCKVNHCIVCKIANCPEIVNKKPKLCSICSKFPCQRLKQIDKRYRTKYSTGLIDNLKFIKEQGMQKFLANEKKRWECPVCKGIICVHTGKCSSCEPK
jgi:hypothetical protein